MSKMKLTGAWALLFAMAAFMAPAQAAPVWLQDYEAPGDLDAPFNFQPDASGSSEGVFNEDSPNDADTSTIALDAADGALLTAQSAELNIIDESGVAGFTGVAGATAYSVRLIPNAGANQTMNPAFASDGYVGFYLKTDASAAGLQVAPILEPTSGGTFASDAGILQPVIADGQWHRYQWNMDDQADFPNSFGGLLGGANDTEQGLGAMVFFDSIAILATGADGSSSALVNIDQIGYDNAGELPVQIPEPATLALAGLGLIGLATASRKRR